MSESTASLSQRGVNGAGSDSAPQNARGNSAGRFVLGWPHHQLAARVTGVTQATYAAIYRVLGPRAASSAWTILPVDSAQSIATGLFFAARKGAKAPMQNQRLWEPNWQGAMGSDDRAPTPLSSALEDLGPPLP